jgi:hypothetical protein
MRKEATATSPDQAYLVVTYGNTSRKHRPLDRDVIVLGKGRGCDVALVSPEVASVHCLLVRLEHGWQLRDCTGRGGTRLNGEIVTEVLLKDGDTLQVGSFSFEVHLPPGDRPAQLPEPEGLQRLQRSRRNLAHLALRLRKRLRIAELNLRPQQELDREADRLRAMQRDWETRRKHQEQADAAARAELEAREQDLAAHRGRVEAAVLAKHEAQECDFASRREQIEQAERVLAERVASAEERIQAQARELAEAQRQAEASHSQRVDALQQIAAGVAPPADALADMEKATRKLARVARGLRQRHQQLHEQARAFALEQQRLNGPAADSAELNRLREQLAELEKQLATANELTQAQQAELAALQALGDAQAIFVEHSGGIELQRLIASLREQVKERDLLLEKMNQRLAEHSGGTRDEEMADYEEELNQYRRELETDRREMTQQLEQLQERQQDMEDALREAEVQMAKERAQIAREQAELNRLRNELSRASCRNPQAAEVRDRVAALRPAKEGPAEKAAEAAEQAKPTRLRSILNLFGQS